MSTYDTNDKEAAVTMGDVEKDANLESRHSSRPPSDRLVPEDKLFLRTYHERNAGRLVVKPEEARVEFGDDIAKRLKLSRDGRTILWPQPTDDPDDPQNWSDSRKNFQLFIITLAAVVPDFDSGIGIASIFALAKQYDTTSGVINDLTSKSVSIRVSSEFCLLIYMHKIQTRIHHTVLDVSIHAINKSNHEAGVSFS